MKNPAYLGISFYQQNLFRNSAIPVIKLIRHRLECSYFGHKQDAVVSAKRLSINKFKENEMNKS